MDIKQLSTVFDNVVWRNDHSFKCICPCHPYPVDMIVSEVFGQVILFCSAGCSTREIAARVGLTDEDLYHDSELVNGRWVAKRNGIAWNSFDALDSLSRGDGA